MRIVVVEDHSMVREAVRHVCVQECGFAVVGEAVTGAAALPLVVQHRPDLVILDLGLPDQDGFEVAERILAANPTTRILVPTAHVDQATVYRAEKLRVQGFLDKTHNTTETLRVALEMLASGRTYFSPAFLAARSARRADTRSFEKILSETEQQVLALAGEGLSDAEIGGRLGISPTTAQTHRSKLLQKLGIKGSAKLVAYALNHGFTRLPTRPPLLPDGQPEPATD